MALLAAIIPIMAGQVQLDTDDEHAGLKPTHVDKQIMVTTLLTELAPAPTITHQQQELAISLNRLSPPNLYMKLEKCSTSPNTKLQKAPPASPFIMLMMQ